MKKLFPLALLAASTFFYSCSSDGDGDDNTSTTAGSITADINGNDWASINGGAVANVMEMSGVGGGMALQIVGVNADQSSVSIQFPIENLAEGTYTFSGESDGLLTYSTNSTMYSSDGNSGTFTLNITDINLETGKISGTFSGTLINWFDESSITLTNGQINNVMLIGSSFYSNGSMTLTRGTGTPFTMDNNQDDGSYLMLNQNTMTNNLMLFGYNTNTSSDFGIYSLNFPVNAAPGTYTLEEGSDYSAGLGSEDGTAGYHLISGTMTITSHSGNNVVGTFSYIAYNGSTTVHINNGSFNVTHN